MRSLLCGTMLAAIMFGMPPARAQGQTQPVSETNFQVNTTQDLVTLCGAQETHALYTAAQNFCHGYALGTYRTLVSTQNGLRSKKKLFCMPNPGLSRNDAIAAFKQWAAATPDAMAMPASDGILRFLVQQYPCK